jgi:hypothetical protein
MRPFWRKQSMDKTIRIECQGADSVDIDQLHELQGNLKTQTDEGYVKQRNSIERLGFSFPMDVWKDQDGKLWEIDGHRRLRTLRRMREEEGFVIPPIPISYVFANNRVQAKQKLLAGISKYEEVTAGGMEEFVNEAGFELVMDDAEDYLAVPEIDFGDGEYKEGTGEQEEAGPKQKSLKEIECPNCSHKFTI